MSFAGRIKKKRSREKGGAAPLKTRLTNTMILMTVIGSIIALVGYAAERYMANALESEAVAYVNDDPISMSQFHQAAQLHRAVVANEFIQAYGAKVSSEFWTASYEGETPLERLKERTLDGLVRGMVIRQLAREHGLLEDVSYKSFLEGWEAENERRREAVSHGQVIYGPVQYSKQDYEVYVLNNLELELEQRIIPSLEDVNEAEWLSFYEERKNELYRNGVSGKAAVIYIPYTGEGVSRTKLEAEMLIEEAKSKIDRGKTFEDIAEKYHDHKFPDEYIFTSATRGQDWKYDAALRGAAERLQNGQVSEIIELVSNSSHDAGFYILKSLERVEEGVRPLEEVKEHVAVAYSKMKFQEFLHKKTQEAIVELNEEVYDRLSTAMQFDL